ncbi:MAG: transporter [Acidobacteria bacterium]|nr:transporter [Acidobacteriota bacterium]
MSALRTLTISTLLLLPAGAALGQAAAPSPIVTDRPGLLFSSLTVGRGVFQTEWGIPAVTLDSSGGVDTRLTSLFGLVRYGVTQNFELRLDGPVYNEVRVRANGHTATDRGYGDLEVGAKWHLFDNQGARPSFALIPSVILPTGEKGFTADNPVYQLNAMAEWNLANGWGAGALAGYLNGPSGDGRYGQGTFAVSLGRSLPSPKWNAYSEAVYVATHLAGASDASFLGGGIKYLISNDVQLDLSFDRGLTADAPNWLFGFGVAARF